MCHMRRRIPVEGRGAAALQFAHGCLHRGPQLPLFHSRAPLQRLQQALVARNFRLSFIRAPCRLLPPRELPRHIHAQYL
jgi:hypothetical protein